MPIFITSRYNRSANKKVSAPTIANRRTGGKPSESSRVREDQSSRLFLKMADNQTAMDIPASDHAPGTLRNSGGDTEKLEDSI
jgi:hypothetical protein